ncbi:MAG: isocitrate lyase, partial [bacterium]|nr:isocitrate lyase [bacterium]
LLAYNCSPSFNWRHHLSDEQIAAFQDRIAALGYKFQFITLAGWHLLNYHTFDLARSYDAAGMAAYSHLQQTEIASEPFGYTATKHQAEVGAGYFDEVMQVTTGGRASTLALVGSTEAKQFN